MTKKDGMSRLSRSKMIILQVLAIKKDLRQGTYPLASAVPAWVRVVVTTSSVTVPNIFGCPCLDRGMEIGVCLIKGDPDVSIYIYPTGNG